MNKKDAKDSENLFEIMEGIIDQLNRTKRIFVTLLIAHLIIVPIAFVVTFAVFGPPFPMGGPWHGGDDSGPGNGQSFAFGRFIPIVVVLVWLGFGIKQWMALSKWTKKYEIYKEVQKKLDEKLGYEDEPGENGESSTDEKKS